jgi:chorismate--pyruvate lyase
MADTPAFPIQGLLAILQAARRPTHPNLHAWLGAPGSLTARLRKMGTVQVLVVRQGTYPLLPEEQRDLHCRGGHVREVLLLVDGVPAIWARSALPHAGLRGPWKALARLGRRPLAELLFAKQHICRTPLRCIPIASHGPLHNHLRTAWSEARGGMPDASVPRWGRSSVFWRHGQPLRVMEVFAPWFARVALM